MMGDGRDNRGVASVCMRCGYDLTGLGVEVVCPECGCAIAASIGHAKGGARPLPGWLRNFRTAYVTVYLVLVASMFGLPPLATTLGMRAPGYGRFPEVYGACLNAMTVMAGVLIIALVVNRRYWSAGVVVASLVLSGVFLPVFGS